MQSALLAGRHPFPHRDKNRKQKPFQHRETRCAIPLGPMTALFLGLLWASFSGKPGGYSPWITLLDYSWLEVSWLSVKWRSDVLR
jgi:hypothetical protein